MLTNFTPRVTTATHGGDHKDDHTASSDLFMVVTASDKVTTPSNVASSRGPSVSGNHVEDDDEEDSSVSEDASESGNAGVDDDAGTDTANTISIDTAADVEVLEKELERVNLELAVVRKERDSQRQELHQLQGEHDNLRHQQDQRSKRAQLNSQLDDLERSVERKVQKKERAIEELEQVKTHHRQLKRTLGLLQQGVRDILARSFQPQENMDEEAREMQRRRELLLRRLLSEDLKLRLLTPSQSNLRVGGDDEDDVGDDDIHDDEGGGGGGGGGGSGGATTTTLFADKKKRIDSLNSEMSEDEYKLHKSSIVEALTADPSTNNRSARSRSSDSSSHHRRKGRDRSHSRDRSTGGSSTGQQSNSSQHNKSRSRRGRRPKKGDSTAAPGGSQQQTVTDKSNASALANMLESNRVEDDAENASEDTPKTANTQDMN